MVEHLVGLASRSGRASSSSVVEHLVGLVERPVGM